MDRLDFTAPASIERARLRAEAEFAPLWSHTRRRPWKFSRRVQIHEPSRQSSAPRTAVTGVDVPDLSFGLVRSQQTLIVAAIVAAHGASNGFRLTDVRFFFFLFSNWMERDILQPDDRRS